MKRKIKLLSLLATIVVLTAPSPEAAAQGTVVTGIILDNRQVPIVGATVCQVNTPNCTAADMNGIFHLLLEAGQGMSLEAKCLGFNPVEIVIDEATTFPVKINMTSLYIPDDFYMTDNLISHGSGSFMRS